MVGHDVIDYFQMRRRPVDVGDIVIIRRIARALGEGDPDRIVFLPLNRASDPATKP